MARASHTTGASSPSGAPGDDDTRTVRLYCREEGNKIRKDFCNNAGDFAPDLGDENSNCEEGPPCYQEKEVPVNQGIFVYDTVGKGKLWMVARAGIDGDFDDFVYWNYSGAPPGAEARAMVNRRAGAPPPLWQYPSGPVPRSGLHFWPSAGTSILAQTSMMTRLTVFTWSKYWVQSRPTLTPLFQTGMEGTILDPQALDADTNQPLPITSLGLERDSFRGRWLAINASMGNEESGWAGIYVTKMPLLED